MEWMAVEYLANAFWQLPLLALGAWLLLTMCRPGPATQHRVWLAVLALGLLLPLRGAVPVNASNAAELPAATVVPTGSSHAGQSGPSASLTTANAPDLAQDSISSADKSWLRDIAAAFSASVQRVNVSATLAQWIVGLWLAVALWGVLRVVLAWRVARRLVANSRGTALDERRWATLRECAMRVRVKLPEIRESDEIAGPVIVGAARPVLLWPDKFAQTSDEEMRAAFCHELAHVRRCDYAMNLLCEMAALPLKWHPAMHRVERRIRATREMACDAVAAEAMDSEAAYAECLVRLARNIVNGGAVEASLASGLFNGNVMEERVMRLMRGKSTMSLRAKVVRGAAGTTAMLAAAAVAAAFHLTPAMAQEIPAIPPAPIQAAPAAPPALAQAVPAIPAAPIIAPAVPAVAPAPVKLSPSIVLVPAAPVIIVAKVPAAPLVPAVSAVVPVPLAPMAAPQVNVQPPPQLHNSRPVVKNDQARGLTPAERARIERQLADAQRKIAAATAKIDSPEFQRQLEDAQSKASQLVAKIDSAEFQKRMADAQKQLAEAKARLDSPEFQKQMEEAQRKATQAVSQIDSAVFHKQMADAQAAALRAQTMINSAEFQKQMADAQKQIAEATARLNSPEFRKQIEDATQAAAKVNSAEFQKQMADAQKQVADALARMKAEQEKGAAK